MSFMSKRIQPGRFAGVVLASLVACAGGAHAATVLTPVQAGLFQAGEGVDGEFLKISDEWHASSV
ncbi:MAG TPA: hypothetical protein VF291_02880, partial [Burkholderiaceae bacterium]